MRCDMWFGTQDYSQWIPTPQSGADVSPSAWGASGTFLNGQGYAVNSRSSHKRFNFSWGTTNARETAQLVKSYFDGSFGTGKIYFVDPLTYTTNILPARWASPSITCDFEGPSLVPGVNPTRVSTSTPETLRLPVSVAAYDLTGEAPVTSSLSKVSQQGLFIPVPDGFQLNLGAFYVYTGGSGVWVTPCARGGQATGPLRRLSPLTGTESDLFPDTYTKAPGEIGVYLWFGNEGTSSNSHLYVLALQARLNLIGTPLTGGRMWVGGQGNEGTRFVGPPTYINNNGRNGGQIEFSATFTESVL